MRYCGLWEAHVIALSTVSVMRINDYSPMGVHGNGLDIGIMGVHRVSDSPKHRKVRVLSGEWMESVLVSNIIKIANCEASAILSISTSINVNMAPRKWTTSEQEEHEAYSKLYYADQVQKNIQETLKVAQATRSLTNGQRVALVKKETAALYAGESEDIKAKVKEYIHAQKEEHGKGKAEPWSDDNQQRNLTKLATIANQFLKGLTDATSLSFSLLVGGPSVELGGMIDVWSQNDTHLCCFHIGMTKLGNNFSQAYPKFESDIVGPFRDYLYSEAAALKDQKMGGASSSSSLWGDSLNQPSYPVSDMMDELSNQDTSLSGMFQSPDLSKFPSSSNGPDLSKFLPSSNGPGSPTLPFGSHNVLSGDNQQDWPLSEDLDNFLETLAQNLPINAEEPNSDRPDALPASSVAEDPTEDSCPSSIPTCTPPSADSCTPSIPTHTSPSADLCPPSIPSCTSSLADLCPPSIPSRTSPLANIANEAQENKVQTEAQADEVQTDKGNDSGGPRRTRCAHIPSTRNTIANSIGNSLNPASKCSHGTDSSAHVGQQTKKPRV
ncbi:hypothetical protein DEU56DRAFT_751286 [Suillus clintonianus]|uniref:uncharacterized protein n=1 Tax=Suillus clintonianus TaxID=1904413 RepID=UPI001B87C914|nr:uncharacterized protein DEU56DRAFT_751286 [Suillus clintonianus]KAG2154601.1 hypothetical protein DEU56DRAFT_751286 [Suillus clintonianus]